MKMYALVLDVLANLNDTINSIDLVMLDLEIQMVDLEVDKGASV